MKNAAKDGILTKNIDACESEFAECGNCFGDPEMVFVPEAPLLNVPQAAIVADPLLAKFEKAGEEYEQVMSLSRETASLMETPMIPKEEYLRNVNGK
ncbi:MAG: hypothetical protein J5950_03190 [Clostridia bacterium]|nr:hypothetical protein [Clostridia bacterium]